MNGLTVCGGWDANDEKPTPLGDCKTLGGRFGGWETSHTLSEGRVKHVSWRRDDGIVLMGGFSSGTYNFNTTEVAGQDGSVAEGPFGLKYETGYVNKNYIYLES